MNPAPEPKRRRSVRRPMARKSSPFKFVIRLWLAILVVIVLIAVIPTWRSEATYRFWTIQGWPEDSMFRRILLSGPEGLDELLSRGGLEHEVIREALFNIDPSAFPRLWDLLAAEKDPGTRAVYESIFAHHAYQRAVESSVLAATTSSQELARRAAIHLALDMKVGDPATWWKDSSAHIRAAVLPHVLSVETCSEALNDDDPVVLELLFQTIRQHERLGEFEFQLEEMMSLPGFSLEDPRARQDHDGLRARLDAARDLLSVMGDAVAGQLKDLINSENADITAKACEVASRLEIDGSVLELLRGALTHKDPEVRRQAMMALAQHGDQQVAGDLWSSARSDPSIIVSLTAWEALRILKPVSLREELKGYVLETATTHLDHALKALDVLTGMLTEDDREFLESLSAGYSFDLARRARAELRRLDASR